MPGYVSYVGGVDAAVPAGTIAVRTRTLAAAALFVAGFSATFTLMGFAASTLSGTILHHRSGLERIAGVVVIVMGLATMGLLRVPLLAREARMDLRRMRPGLGGAAPLGAAFAIGWTPCIGPVLTASRHPSTRRPPDRGRRTRGGRGEHMIRRVGCAVALAAILMVASASAAFAHSGFVSSTPEPGATLGSAPGQVTLTFSEPLNVRLSRAAVHVPDGSSVAGRVVGDEGMVVDLTTGQPGVYEVDW